MLGADRFARTLATAIWGEHYKTLGKRRIFSRPAYRREAAILLALLVLVPSVL